MNDNDRRVARTAAVAIAATGLALFHAGMTSAAIAQWVLAALIALLTFIPPTRKK